jgi:hypothetical protein
MVMEKEKLIQDLLNPDQNETSNILAENRKLKREVKLT